MENLKFYSASIYTHLKRAGRGPRGGRGGVGGGGGGGGGDCQPSLTVTYNHNITIVVMYTSPTPVIIQLYHNMCIHVHV